MTYSPDISTDDLPCYRDIEIGVNEIYPSRSYAHTDAHCLFWDCPVTLWDTHKTILVLIFHKNPAHSNYPIPLSNGSIGYHRPNQPVSIFYMNPITAPFSNFIAFVFRIVIVAHSRHNRITPTYSATPP